MNNYQTALTWVKNTSAMMNPGKTIVSDSFFEPFTNSESDLLIKTLEKEGFKVERVQTKGAVITTPLSV